MKGENSKCEFCGQAMPVEPDGIVEVFTTWNTLEIGFMESLLDSNGIKTLVQNLYYPSITPVGSGAVPIKLFVRTTDAALAKEIIEQYYKDLREEEVKGEESEKENT